MSALPGDKPDRQRNFHGTRGEHIFPHPETYEPRRSAWTAWERRYAAHLDRHRQQATDPSALPSDGPAIVALFNHIEHLKEIIKKEQQLIVALRQRAAEHPEAPDLKLSLPIPGGDDLDGGH